MYKVTTNDKQTNHISFDGEKWNSDKKVLQTDISRISDSVYHALINGHSYRIIVPAEQAGKKELEMFVNGHLYKIQIRDKYDLLLKELGIENLSGKVAEPVKSPMPGKVLEVNIDSGDTVKEGQTLMILEAMKMENVIKATADATVKSVKVTTGDNVEKGAILIEFDAPTET